MAAKRVRARKRAQAGKPLDITGVPQRENQYVGLKPGLFTPADEELVGMLTRLATELGGWESLGRGARMSSRHIRRIRRAQRAVGYDTMERMLRNLGREELLDTLTWYTAEELTKMGLWRPELKTDAPEFREWLRRTRKVRLAG
jgi:hypothetical protein